MIWGQAAPLSGQFSSQNTTNVIKWCSMVDSYDQIDNLFAQVRLRLLEIRQSDPAIVEELKSLVSQLEDYVEQLVIDSLKLKNLESGAGKKTKAGKRAPRKKPGGN